MKADPSIVKYGQIVPIALVSTTLIVSPFWTLEPFNLPKLCVLIILGTVSIGFLLSNFRSVSNKIPPYIRVLIAALYFCLGLNFMYWHIKNSTNLYGTEGRNTGYLAYVFLITLWIISIFVTTKDLLRRLNKVIVAVGLTLSIYGILQSLNYDVFPYNNIYSSSVIGTFGNPNFMSAFLGLFGSYLFTLFFKSDKSKKTWVFLLVNLALTTFGILLTKSIQGFLTLAVGVGAAIIMLMYVTDKKFIARIFLLGYLGSGFLFGLALLNLGPLASWVSGSTLTYRRVYWETAWSMLQNNIFFGVGMDNYGEMFRSYRSLENATNYPNLYADAAHNVFLDLGAGGGFPLLLLYLFVNLLTLHSVVKYLINTKKIDVIFIAISTAWIAFTAQSLISINQLGLAIWGWILSGTIIGYQINSQKLLSISGKNARKNANGLLSERNLIVIFVFGLVGVAIAAPPYLAAVKYRNAIITADAVKIQNSASIWPYEKSRFLQVIQILENNQLHAQAKNVAIQGSKIFPNSFEIWKAYSRLNELSPTEKEKISLELKRLDPHYQDKSNG